MKLAVLVEEEAAIEVAVPGDPEVRTVLAQRLDRRPVVLGQHRVRHAVREGAVRLVLHLDELERQERLEPVDDSPAPPLPAFTTIFSGLQLRAVDVAQQVLDVLRHDVDCEALAGRRAGVVNLPASAIARISCRPVSPLIGREPSRTNFMPF